MDIRKTLLLLIAGYCSLWLMFLLFANSVIYQPPRPSTYQDSPHIIKLAMPATNDKLQQLSALYLPNPKADYTLLYLHGNAGDLGQVAPLLRYFHHNGYAVFSYDYPGYGTSDGSPSEAKLYQSARVAYHYLVDTLSIPSQNIIIYGKSLGSAIALDLALEEPAAGLVMDSPFLSAFRVYTQLPLFPLDHFVSTNKIQRLTMPLFIIHGTNDTILWPWQARRLYELAPPPKSAYWVQGAGHNTVLMVAGKHFWARLKQFLDQQVKETP